MWLTVSLSSVLTCSCCICVCCPAFNGEWISGEFTFSLPVCVGLCLHLSFLVGECIYNASFIQSVFIAFLWCGYCEIPFVSVINFSFIFLLMYKKEILIILTFPKLQDMKYIDYFGICCYKKVEIPISFSCSLWPTLDITVY